MLTSKKVILKVDRRNPKYGYLKLQTIIDSKAKEKTLKRKIQVKHWNSTTMHVRSTEPDAKKINQEIQEALHTLPNTKVSQSKKVKEESFFDFAYKKLQVIHLKSTRDVKLYALNKLKEFVEIEGKDDLLFNEIDPFFVEKFYNHLKTTMNKKSSANAYMIIFRYFINEADKYDVYTYSKDPFKQLSISRVNNTHSVMTPYEVELFFQYEPKDKSYLLVQSAFGFMMHCAGIRISDLLNLRWKNFKRQGESYFVEYRMQKTSKLMQTKLSLDALEYLLPFIADYGEDKLIGYKNLKKQIDKEKSSLESLRKELKELKPVSIYEVFSVGKDNYDAKLREGIEIDKEEKRIKTGIKIYKDAIEFNRKALISTIAHLCFNLKDSVPNDTVIPDCREVPKEELKKVQHAVKVRYNYRLQEIQKEQEIKTKITNHQARHIFAQRLFEAGANFHYISLALGHASLQITESYREQLINDEAKDVVEVFSDLLREKDDLDEVITRKEYKIPYNEAIKNFPSIKYVNP